MKNTINNKKGYKIVTKRRKSIVDPTIANMSELLLCCICNVGINMHVNVKITFKLVMVYTYNI